MLLEQERIHAQLADCPIGHTLFYYESIPSTMPIANQLAADPTVRSGAMVIAEEQTAGRGRLQRRWETPLGDALLVSFIFKAPFRVPPTHFSMLAGLAIQQGLAAYLPPLAPYLGLKWPNDLLLGTSWATAGKMVGILIEAVYRGDQAVAVIVGCGLNVMQSATALPQTPPGAPPATSLRHFLDHQPTLAAQCPPLNRTDLLVAICRTWAQIYLDPALTPALLQQRWAQQLWTLQQTVVVQTTAADGTATPLTGRAIAVTADGQLVVESANGERHSFAAGDVSLRLPDRT
ncbi:MAG: biotin--[acetyl-CoA-carboxylase] ligase [Caldilineaceae bacterium]|nr:biotin--[acetyl-CoA-carboxylase] ligase [Caldilineaceae bacterium]